MMKLSIVGSSFHLIVAWDICKKDLHCDLPQYKSCLLVETGCLSIG